MSKEAIGGRGAPMGTGSYFAQLGSGNTLSSYLLSESSYGYRGALDALGSAARAVLTTIQGDLNQHRDILRYLPSEQRERTAQLVSALGDLCALSHGDSGPANECLSQLSLSGFAGMTRSFATDSDLERGLALVRGGGESGLDTALRRGTLQEAAQWGESFAAGGDDQKRYFLEELQRQQSNGYLADLWDLLHYQDSPGDYCAANGCLFCSEDYVAALERQLFPQSSGLIQTDYAQMVSRELQEMLDQIQQDVATAVQQGDYLPDDLGEHLLQALDELEDCGLIPAFSLRHDIRALCWYSPLDTGRVTALQRALNQIPLGTRLDEDGVYGPETSTALGAFYEFLFSSAVPVAEAVDTISTGADLTSPVLDGLGFGTMLFDQTQGGPSRQLLGTARKRVGSNFKITGNGHRVKRPTMLPNYRQVSPKTFAFLQRFKGPAKIIKKAGRVLLVVGVGLEILDTIEEIGAALQGAEDKMGAAIGRAVGGFIGTLLGLVGAGVFTTFVASIVSSAPAIIVGGVVVIGVGISLPLVGEALGEMIGAGIGSQFDSPILDVTTILG